MLYYDAFTSGLIPVRVVRWATEWPHNRFTLEVEVTRDKGLYKKGERIFTNRSSIVVKTRKSGIHQMVASATDEQLGL